MTTSLRDRKKQRARAELARAAMTLFREQGFEATTIEQIAAAAEYSTSTFCRHFNTKEDVAFLGVDQDLQDFATALAHRSADSPFWQVLHDALCATLVRFSERGPDLELASVQAWLTEPAFATRYRTFCSDWEEVIADAWAAEHGLPDASVNLDAQLVARLVVGAVEACFVVHVRTGTDTLTLFKQAFDRLVPIVEAETDLGPA